MRAQHKPTHGAELPYPVPPRPAPVRTLAHYALITTGLQSAERRHLQLGQMGPLVLGPGDDRPAGRTPSSHQRSQGMFVLR